MYFQYLRMIVLLEQIQGLKSKFSHEWKRKKEATPHHTSPVFQQWQAKSVPLI